MFDKYYEQAIKNLEEARKNYMYSDGYWFYVESQIGGSPADSNISVYVNYELEPMLVLPHSAENLEFAQYVVAMQNGLSAFTKRVTLLEDILLGTADENDKKELLDELSNKV